MSCSTAKMTMWCFDDDGNSRTDDSDYLESVMQPLDLKLQAVYVLFVHCVAGLGFMQLLFVMPYLLMQHLQMQHVHECILQTKLTLSSGMEDASERRRSACCKVAKQT